MAQVTLSAKGLNTSANQLNLPDGSLAKASNVIIQSDNVIQPRRGYFLYSNTFGSSTDVSKQLITYKTRILNHYSNVLQFDDGAGNLTSFNGSYLEPHAGIKIKSIEQNGNLYFTTSDGIKKISAKVPQDLSATSGYIIDAGAPKALNLNASLDITLGSITGFLPVDSVVAYRMTWATKDLNGNLIEGAPSDIINLYNPFSPIVVMDVFNLLHGLDQLTAGVLATGGYTQSIRSLENPPLSISSSPDEIIDALYLNTNSLVNTLETTVNANLFNKKTLTRARTNGVATLTFAAGIDTYLKLGDTVTINGLSDSSFNVSGVKLTSVSSTSVSFVNAGTNVSSTADTAGYTIRSLYTNTAIVPSPGVISIPANHNDYVAIKTTLDGIIQQLKLEPTGNINSTQRALYIDNIFSTTSTNADITFNIPIPGINSNWFYRIYRTDVREADGTDVLSRLSPGDEMKLVIEDYPTADQLTVKQVTVLDETPSSANGIFTGTDLYTNASEEGLQKANTPPPYAKDINQYKGYAFYANTKTKQSKLINLIGVSQMVQNIKTGSGVPSKLSVTDGNVTNTYTFVLGSTQTTNITFGATDGGVNTLASSGTPSYFIINSSQDKDTYYFWYSQGTATTDPTPTGKISVKIPLAGTETNAQVAVKTRDQLNFYTQSFNSSIISPARTVFVQNVDNGVTTSTVTSGAGIVATTANVGTGENPSLNEVLLSDNDSASIAIEETAKSLVNVINRDPNSLIWAYYITIPTQAPGSILIERKTLDQNPTYFIGSDQYIGISFNPNVTPDFTVSTFPGAVTTIVTPSPHGFGATGQKVNIVVVQSTNLLVDGIYTATITGPSNLTIPIASSGTPGFAVIDRVNSSLFSESEAKGNRIYFSKFQEPESVPSTNYLDVGSSDKNILRIFPLRDSLFVFKEDGLYRISGEIDPFNVSLFDGSCILSSVDSLGLNNNIIFAFTIQGIQEITESGVSFPLSRVIDDQVLKYQTYSAFRTASWGIGYPSDNAYLFFTVKKPTDTIPTICYRYSSLTSTWTIFDKTNTSGIINPVDGKMYLGAGDINRIEKERKSFDRYDYSDREIDLNINLLSVSQNNIRFSGISSISVGDVLVQSQTLTCYIFNEFLKRLDNEPFFANKNYFSSFNASPGVQIRSNLDSCIAQLAIDSGRTAISGSLPSSSYTKYQSNSSSYTITGIDLNSIVTTSAPHGLFTGSFVNIQGTNSTPIIDGTQEVTVLSSTTFSVPIDISNEGTTGSVTPLNTDFDTIKAAFNGIISTLNSDPGVSARNYTQSTFVTDQEAIVTAINPITKMVTFNINLPYLSGACILYKAIPCEVLYSPVTFGDPLSLKHVREAQIFFSDKNFTNATLSFSSDLIPSFTENPFNGEGNGIFGHSNFGSSYFSGGSSNVPHRTYVTKNHQRCRFLNVKYNHSVAREKWAINGITLFSNEQSGSSRAYRS